jgi:RNA polymerase sigma factor (sigma-70 family)
MLTEENNVKCFIGQAEVYDEKISINTKTGQGVDKVIKKINPLLCKMASKTFISGYNFEDLKQELSIMSIEGIKYYDSSKGVKLSTFLHIHLKNKIISKLKTQNIDKKNASWCHVGAQTSTSKIPRVKEAVNFGDIKLTQTDDSNDAQQIDGKLKDGNSQILGGGRAISYNDVDFEVSLRKIIEKLDNRTKTIIELMYFQDFSLKDAAEEAGLSDWAASVRLKKLSEKRSFKVLFNKQEESDSDESTGRNP